MEVKIKFTRKPLDVFEEGIAVLEMPEGYRREDIEKKMAENDFKRFVIRSRKTEDYEWEWKVTK